MSRRRPRVPGTTSLRGLTVIVVDEHQYVAPRVGDAAAKGRTIRRARCGHSVYVGERGLDAIGRRGKHLICEPCAAAVAAERGGRLAVYSFDDDAGEPPAGRNTT